MNYEKLTPEKFSEKLKNNEYDSLTGARRAIGKASWSENAKNTARAQAEKFFGGAAPAKAAPKKAAKASAKTAAPKGKPGRKPGSGKKGRAHAESPVATMTEHQGQTFPVGGKQITITEIRKNPFHTIQLAEHGVASGTNVINALTEMKKQDPNVDITEPMAAAVDTVKSSLRLTSLVIQTLSEGVEVPKAIAKAAAQNGVTHAQETETVPGNPVYTAPSAEA